MYTKVLYIYIYIYKTYEGLSAVTGLTVHKYIIYI